MIQSILNSTKKSLGIEPDYDEFDDDILLQINSVLAILTQLGIGPEEGFMIEDENAEWIDFVGNDNRLLMVKNYVFLRVRQNFDPPTTSFLLASMEEQIRELGVRINVVREGDHWVRPTLQYPA